MAVTSYTAWLADGSPAHAAFPTRALALNLHAYGYNIGRTDVVGLGDERHLLADPPMDHTPYSATPWPGAQPYPYVLAFDIMTPVPAGMPSLTVLGAKLFADKQAGRAELAWLKYMNWTDSAGRTWHDSWKPTWYRTSSTDTGHIHLSGRTDHVYSTVAATYDPIAELSGATMPDVNDLYAWQRIEAITYLQDAFSGAGGFADLPTKGSKVPFTTALDEIRAGVRTLIDRPPAAFTTEQVTAMAGQVAVALVAAEDNPLTDAELAAVAAKVKQVLAAALSG